MDNFSFGIPRIDIDPRRMVVAMFFWVEATSPLLDVVILCVACIPHHASGTCDSKFVSLIGFKIAPKWALDVRVVMGHSNVARYAFGGVCGGVGKVFFALSNLLHWHVND